MDDVSDDSTKRFVIALVTATSCFNHIHVDLSPVEVTPNERNDILKKSQSRKEIQLLKCPMPVEVSMRIAVFEKEALQHRSQRTINFIKTIKRKISPNNNEFGRKPVKSETFLYINGPKFKFINDDHPIVVKAGDPLKLIFDLYVPPGCWKALENFRASWWKNGKVLPRDKRFKHMTEVIPNDEVPSLVIDRVRPDDGGSYQVKIFLSSNEILVSPTRKVVVNCEEVKFIKPLQEKIKVNIEDNDVEGVVLECEFTGTPSSPSVTWYETYEDGEKIPICDSSSYEILTKVGSAKLLVRSPFFFVRCKLTGCEGVLDPGFTCRVESQSGSAETGTKLVLAKSPPKILTKLKDVTLNQGDGASMTCRAVGWPTPKLRWVLKGSPICRTGSIEFPNIRIDELEKCKIFETAQTISMTNIDKDVEGILRIVARNDLGSSLQEAHLYVTTKKPPFAKELINPLREEKLQYGRAIAVQTNPKGDQNRPENRDQRNPTPYVAEKNADLSGKGVPPFTCNTFGDQRNLTPSVAETTADLSGKGVPPFTCNKFGDQRNLTPSVAETTADLSGKGVPPFTCNTFGDQRNLTPSVAETTADLSGKGVPPFTCNKFGDQRNLTPSVAETTADLSGKGVPPFTCNTFGDQRNLTPSVAETTADLSGKGVPPFTCNKFGDQRNLTPSVAETTADLSGKGVPPFTCNTFGDQRNLTPSVAETTADLSGKGVPPFTCNKFGDQRNLTPSVAETTADLSGKGVPPFTCNTFGDQRNLTPSVAETTADLSGKGVPPFTCNKFGDQRNLTPSVAETTADPSGKGAAPVMCNKYVEQSICINDDCCFSVMLNGRSDITAEWFKNRKLISNEGRFSVRKSKVERGIRFYFTISRVEHDDSGLYEFRFFNSSGEASVTGSLKVIDNREPNFEGFGKRDLIEGQEFCLSVHGHDLTNIQWSKNELALDKNIPRYEIDCNRTAGLYSLKIRKAAIQDKGRYTVNVCRRDKEWISSCQLNVQETKSTEELPECPLALGSSVELLLRLIKAKDSPHVRDQNEWMVEKAYMKRNCSGQTICQKWQAQFISKYIVEDGLRMRRFQRQSVEMTVTTRESCKKVSWLKNGRILHEAGNAMKYNMTSASIDHKLVVNDLGIDDEGIYSFQAFQ